MQCNIHKLIGSATLTSELFLSLHEQNPVQCDLLDDTQHQFKTQNLTKA